MATKTDWFQKSTDIFVETDDVEEKLAKKSNVLDLPDNETKASITAKPPKSTTEAPTSKRSRKSREAHLIDSMRHMGEGGEQAVQCVTHCRYGAESHARRTSSTR